VIEARDRRAVGKTCERDWFAYLDVTRIATPSLPDSQVGLSCPVRPPRAAAPASESDFPWLEVLFVLAVIIAIVVICVKACRGRGHRPARGYVAPPVYVRQPVYVEPPIYTEPPVYAHLGHVGGYHHSPMDDDPPRRRDWEDAPTYRNLPPPRPLYEDSERYQEPDPPRQTAPVFTNRATENLPPYPPPGLTRAPPISPAQSTDDHPYRNLPPSPTRPVSENHERRQEPAPPRRAAPISDIRPAQNLPPPPPPGLTRAAPITRDCLHN
jgi:hypothetical protein